MAAQSSRCPNWDSPESSRRSAVAFCCLASSRAPLPFSLAGEMAVAYFQGHSSHGIWPMMNGGQPAVLYCFIWLYLSAAGGGPWSSTRCAADNRNKLHERKQKKKSAENETSRAESFIITQCFRRPRDLVFNAWTDPKHVAQWWGPKGFTKTDP